MSPTKRKAAEIAVPAIQEDPAERKRVLNVLAQRRYRQRKREHVKSLESRALRQPESMSSDEGAIISQTSEDTGTPVSEPTYSSTRTPGDFLEEHPRPNSLYDGVEIVYPEGSDHTLDDPFAMFDSDFTTCSPKAVSYAATGWDSSMMLPSLPGSPLSPTNHSSPTALTSPRTTRSSSPGSFSFPDDANLQVLELTLLRGALAIADRLQCKDLIWSLTAESLFTTPSSVMKTFDHLPSNLQPTVVQLTQPHHPILDLLPWPNVRDKLIMVFSQPPEYRPPSAASPTALLDFVYDLEDSAEGVRICGQDPYSDQAWEVGEKLFKNWWWALDGQVIRRSNEMRSMRGAKLLGDGTRGSILGEVT